MLVARRANVALDIKDIDADFYLAKGFSIYDGTELIKKAPPQTIDDYKAELHRLQTRVAELEDELAAVHKKKATKKKED